MDVPDEAEAQALETLISTGYQQVKDGEFEEALKTAHAIEDLRHTTAFEIAALAKLGLDDTEAAIAVLQRGLKLASDVWVNWQLLGNTFSDLGRYEEAENAFRDALRCSEPWVDSIRLNQAILLGRQGKPEEALKLFDGIQDPDLQFEVAAARINTLGRLGHKEQALEVAQALLQQTPLCASDEDAWFYVAVLELRMRFEAGLEPEVVRQEALDLLREESDNEHVLTLLRDTRGERSKDNRYLRLLVHGNDAQGEVAADGFYVPYDVVAENSEDALQYIEEIEATRGFDHLEIEECEVLAKRTKDPKGVYLFGGRAYYSE
ncbi:MAG: hypothetical protein H6830_08295 [Planctomycetes bacterium]|nr:hypothetical protein [Planctomycetota bacterium]MCB9911784.1 hypothetical protein [Planctomycetota bacterium]HRV80228.1 hypothetical protein [Planctomycetota bacterium]